jgi:hypothetical protein
VKGKVFIIIIAAALVLAGIALGVGSYINARIDAAVALERARLAEVQIASLDAQLKGKDAAIDAAEALLAKSRQDALERERWFRAQLAKIETATPTELVDQASQILGVSDIATDGKSVTMGLETYRLVVFRIVEHQEYVNVREPAWNAREALYRTEISDWKAKEILHAQKDALNAGIISGLKDVISHRKDVTLFEKVAWAAGGFAAGVLAEKIR